METPLVHKKCVPCEGGIPPLDDERIQRYLADTPAWKVTTETHEEKSVRVLKRTVTLKDFRAAMSLLRKVEELAESEGHHPDFCVHYKVVDFTLWTHAIGGLHDNDFIMAAKIDELLKPV